VAGRPCPTFGKDEIKSDQRFEQRRGQMGFDYEEVICVLTFVKAGGVTVHSRERLDKNLLLLEYTWEWSCFIAHSCAVDDVNNVKRRSGYARKARRATGHSQNRPSRLSLSRRRTNYKQMEIGVGSTNIFFSSFR
jgi:hypothetical protein